MQPDGFITWQIIQGSFNTELFNDFVRNQVLSQCNPFSSPKSIIIMDNASIHHNNISDNSFNESLICRSCRRYVMRQESFSSFYRLTH
jgi:hypothetical protein